MNSSVLISIVVPGDYLTISKNKSETIKFFVVLRMYCHI